MLGSSDARAHVGGQTATFADVAGKVSDRLPLFVGVVILLGVFQWGWGAGLIGLETTVPITTFIPMFMFAMLFGLSMDYEGPCCPGCVRSSSPPETTSMR